MTKPRIKAAPPPDDLDDEREVSDFLDYEALTPRLTEIRQKLGLSDDADIEAKAHVWKLNADGEGTDYKVFEGLPEQYDLRKLAQQFGSGKYKLAVYARNDTGNMPRYINSIVAWMLNPDEEARYLAKRASAQNPQINQPAQNNNDMAMLVAAMTGGFQKLGELIVAANARPATNPLDEMVKLAGVMRTLMPGPGRASGRFHGDHDEVQAVPRCHGRRAIVGGSRPQYRADDGRDSRFRPGPASGRGGATANASAAGDGPANASPRATRRPATHPAGE